MSSYSDAHECAEISIIAAGVQRAPLPRQSQIWAVLRTQDSPQRLAYSLTATMLGRMCLSGEIHELSDEQWTVVSRAISFYRSAVPVIKNGVSHRFGPKVRSYRHPEGWQAVRRLSNDGAQILVVAHRFGAAERTPIEVPLPPGRYEVSELYSHREIVVKLTEELVAVELDEPFSAAALVLTQIELDMPGSPVRAGCRTVGRATSESGAAALRWTPNAERVVHWVGW